MMPYLIRRITLVLSFLVLPLSYSGVRIGILANDPAADLPVQLLTAEFTARSQQAGAGSLAGIELVERREMMRITAEQKLSSMSAENVVRAGRLIGADGLISVEIGKRGTNSVLAVHFISVRPGISLGVHRHAFPIGDPDAWAKRAVNEIAPLIPKLSVLPENALKISVLNLRSARASRTAEQMDRELTSLLLERLSREKDIFVLERRKLDSASLEKELNSETNSFWSGSYLLDGIINKNTDSADTVSISGQLVSPGGKEASAFEVTGSRTNLPNLLESFARTLLGKMNRTATTVWNNAEEATAYLDEAKWALKWEMLPEAQAAADAAWALGLQTKDCAAIRARSYASAASFHRTVIKIDDQGVHYDGPVDPRIIDHALHAAELYVDFDAITPAQEKDADMVWHKLGVDVLDKAGLVLQHYYNEVPDRAGHEMELTELRARCRELSQRLCAFPGIRNYYFYEGKRYSPDEMNQTLQQRKNAFQLTAQFAAFWSEKPEDTIQTYRELINVTGFPEIREKLILRSADQPILCAWSSGDRGGMERLWRGFMEETCGATNLVKRIEGLFLQAAMSRRSDEIHRNYQRLVDTILDNRVALVRHTVQLHYSYDFYRIIAHGLEGAYSPALEEWMLKWRSPRMDPIGKMNDEHWAYFQQEEEKTKNSDQFESARKYLAEFQPYEFTRVTPIFHGTYTKEQAVTLLDLLQLYRSNLVTSGTIKGAKLAGATNFLASIERSLGRQAGRELPRPTNQVVMRAPKGWKPSAPPSMGAGLSAGPVRPAVSAVPSVATPAPKLKEVQPEKTIELVDFWHVPTNSFEYAASGGRLSAHTFREGRLWMRWNYGVETISTNSVTTRVAVKIISVDPLTGKYETIERGLGTWDEETADFFGETRPTLEVLNGKLYLSGKNQLAEYDLAKRKWRELPIDAPRAHLFVIENQLYASTKESILKIDPTAGSATILASTRRRPAATDLDKLGFLDYPQILPGLKNNIRAFVTNSIFDWDGKGWTRTFQFSNMVDVSFCETGSVFVPESPYDKRIAHGMLFTGQKPEVILNLPPAPHSHVRSKMNPDAVWKGVSSEDISRTPVVCLGENYLFYVEHLDLGPSVVSMQPPREKDGRHANLVYLDRRVEEPLVIPLKFALANGPLPHYRALRRGAGASVKMQQTPAGIVIVHDYIAGFWLLPQKVLQSAIENGVTAKLNSLKDLAQRRSELKALLEANQTQ